MADSTFNVTFTFTGVDQAEADTRRDNALVDYAKAYNLMIYTLDGNGAPTTTIDPALVGPAVRAHLWNHAKAVVKGFRVREAGTAAQEAATTAADTELG